jgi:hypothetical protein
MTDEMAQRIASALERIAAALEDGGEDNSMIELMIFPMR